MELNINDFTFSFRQIGRNAFETILSKDNVRFGCTYQSNNPAPPNLIFNEFQKNPKQFFIEVPSEIITDKPIIDLEVIKTELAAPVENKVTEILVDTPTN